MLTVLHGGGASACTMTGLAKYRQYEFFIVPFYKSVDGRPSNSRVARTLEDGKWGRRGGFVIFRCCSSVQCPLGVVVVLIYIVDGGPSIRDGYPFSEREGRNQIIIFRRRRRRRRWWTTMESIALSGIYSEWKEGVRDCLSVND